MKLSDFTMPEVRHLVAECNFTKEEFVVFKLLTEGCTIENVAEITNYSESTIKRIHKKIWSKIDRLMSLG